MQLHQLTKECFQILNKLQFGVVIVCFILSFVYRLGWRIVAGKLPVAIWRLSAATVSNRVLLFGKNDRICVGFS